MMMMSALGNTYVVDTGLIRFDAVKVMTKNLSLGFKQCFDLFEVT